MFPISSQKKFWTFTGPKEILDKRKEQNQAFYQKVFSQTTEHAQYFLTVEEECKLLKQYEIYIIEFCAKFEPIMPKYVTGTSLHYFKRFYLRNSIMTAHPKDIMLTCVYLACKVEEFNVSITQFVDNIQGDRRLAMDVILSKELILMQQLNYYLTIQNPYRPVEGFLIDIKTRSGIKKAERLRPHIDDFLEKTFLTDVCLLFSPSQIAFAAIINAVSKERETLDQYVTDNLLQSAPSKVPAFIGSTFGLLNHVITPKHYCDLSFSPKIDGSNFQIVKCGILPSVEYGKLLVFIK